MLVDEEAPANVAAQVKDVYDFSQLLGEPKRYKVHVQRALLGVCVGRGGDDTQARALVILFHSLTWYSLSVCC